MKQINMFSGELSEDDNKYTKKVEAPIYEPKTKNHIYLNYVISIKHIDL